MQSGADVVGIEQVQHVATRGGAGGDHAQIEEVRAAGVVQFGHEHVYGVVARHAHAEGAGGVKIYDGQIHTHGEHKSRFVACGYGLVTVGAGRNGGRSAAVDLHFVAIDHGHTGRRDTGVTAIIATIIAIVAEDDHNAVA